MIWLPWELINPIECLPPMQERRLLRQDNVFTRLGEKAHSMGLISNELYETIKQEQATVETSLYSAQRR